MKPISCSTICFLLLPLLLMSARSLHQNAAFAQSEGTCIYNVPPKDELCEYKNSGSNFMMVCRVTTKGQAIEEKCLTDLHEMRFDKATLVMGSLVTIDVGSLDVLRITGNGDAENPELGNQYPQALLHNIKQDHDVRDLTIEMSGASKRALEAKNFIFRNINSVFLEKLEFKSLKTLSIELHNVNTFTMSKVKTNRAETSAFYFVYEGQCPESPVNIVLDEVGNLSRFSKDTIVINKGCSGNLNMRFVIKSPEDYRLPEAMFSKVMEMSDISGIEFDSEPIECCQESNAWLFKSRNPGTKSYSFKIACSDIGGSVADWAGNLEKRNSDCLHRNEMPVYVIVTIIAISLLVLLAIMGAAYMYSQKGAGFLGGMFSGAQAAPNEHMSSGVSELNSNMSETPSSATNGQRRPSRSRSKNRRHKNKHGETGSQQALATAAKRPSPDRRPTDETASFKTQATGPASKVIRSGVFQTLA